MPANKSLLSLTSAGILPLISVETGFDPLSVHIWHMHMPVCACILCTYPDTPRARSCHRKSIKLCSACTSMVIPHINHHKYARSAHTQLVPSSSLDSLCEMGPRTMDGPGPCSTSCILSVSIFVGGCSCSLMHRGGAGASIPRAQKSSAGL